MNTRTELDERLTDLMATLFDVDKGEIDESTNIDSLEGWDSVNHMHLVVALEEEFGIEFQDEEAVELISYELIRSHLQEKIGKYRA